MPEINNIRFNPFVFPSETDIRFVILIFSILSYLLMSSSTICYLLLDYIPLEVLALSILLSTLGIWYIYSEYPINIIKEYKTNEISEFPEINKILNRIISNRDLGPKTPKILIYNPKPAKNDIFVFGRQNNFYIAIPSGLAVKIKKQPEIFKTYVHHELAHIANGDVTKTYLTLSAWSFFLYYTSFYFLIIVLIVIIIREYTASVMFLSYMLPGISLFIIIIYFTKNSILRIREFYADQRVVAWDESTINIERLLSSTILPSTKLEFLSGLKNLFAVHPLIGQRLKMLTDNKRLFIPNLWVALGVGILTYTFRFSIVKTIGLCIGIEETHIGLILSIIASLLIVICVGTEVFRSTVWSFSSPGDHLFQRCGLLWLLITAFVMVIGQEVSFLLLKGTNYLLELDLIMFIYDVPLRLLFFFIPLFYITYFGKKLMEHHFGEDKPSRIYFAISILATILCIAYFIPYFIPWINFYVYIALVFLYFLISAIVVELIIQNKSKCPFCNEQIKESFSMDLKCPVCQHDLAGWAKTFMKHSSG